MLTTLHCLKSARDAYCRSECNSALGQWAFVVLMIEGKVEGGPVAALFANQSSEGKVVMRKLLLFFVLAVGLLSNSQAEERRPEMSRYTTAYSGGEGYRVWVARFGPRENHEALVQIDGIDHKLDGRVIRAKAIPSAGGVKYTAVVDGQSYDLLYIDGKNAELRVTGAPWTSTLCYDKSLIDDRPPEHLLTSYLEGAQKK
jgi:hypothetical protein